MKALLVYPEHPPQTYWSFSGALPYIKRRAAMPPLGLITVAAMLPDHWELRLIEACLRAVPQLVDAEAEKVIVRLPVDSKETEMRLAWIDPFEELPNE